MQPLDLLVTRMNNESINFLIFIMFNTTKAVKWILVRFVSSKSCTNVVEPAMRHLCLTVMKITANRRFI